MADTVRAASVPTAVDDVINSPVFMSVLEAAAVETRNVSLISGTVLSMTPYWGYRTKD